MFNLVVTHEFGGYAVGETISESDKIDAALESHAAFVVKVAKPEGEQAPAAPTTGPEETATFFRDHPADAPSGE